jgi:amidohydrolase
VLAAHVHPELDWGAVALDPGPVNASSDTAAILVEGEGTHGAYPHLGADAVLALAHVIVAVHGLVGRGIDPLSAAVITVGDVHAGAAENLVAEAARAHATLRALDPDDRQRLRDLVVEVVEDVSRAHGCRGSVSIVAGEPARVNDPATVAATLPLLASAGFAAAPPWRSCGSDDLAFFGRRAPSRWRSSAFAVRLISRFGRCTTRSSCRPTRLSERSRAHSLRFTSGRQLARARVAASGRGLARQ